MASMCYCEVRFCNLFFTVRSALIKKLFTEPVGKAQAPRCGGCQRGEPRNWGRGFTLCPSRPYSLVSSLKEQIQSLKQSPLFFFFWNMILFFQIEV